jgi:hypothetical protein
MKVKKMLIIAFLAVASLALTLIIVDTIVFNPTYKAKTIFTSEELKTIYRENEEAFEYVKNKLLTLPFDSDFYVGIAKFGKRVVFFNTNVVPRRLEVGYQKDEKFEEYLKLLLVDHKLGSIFCVKRAASLTIQFGHYERILYFEGESKLEEDWPYTGIINENWYYEIFLPV